MKKIKFYIIGMMLIFASSFAQAWQCKAASPYAIGFGYSWDLDTAKTISLNQCAIRTPYFAYCEIVWCR